MLLNGLLVFVGGGLGSVARWGATALIGARMGHAFPWGTVLVNITGSLIIGLFATLTAPEGRWIVPPQARLFFMVGLCGGYTTFSSFSLQTLELLQAGEWFRAALNVFLSVALCLLGVWLGYIMALAMNKGV
jgi:fluoride exporter